MSRYVSLYNSKENNYVRINEPTEYNNDNISVVIPDGVEKIPEQAFCGWRLLEEVKLPSTLKEIGKFAFAASGICFIKVPEGITEISEGAFNECRSLEYVSLPSTIKKINRDVFGRCDYLEKIEIPEGVEKIGDRTFWFCGNLKEIKLPSTLKEIGKEVFVGCNNLKAVEISENMECLSDVKAMMPKGANLIFRLNSREEKMKEFENKVSEILMNSSFEGKFAYFQSFEKDYMAFVSKLSEEDYNKVYRYFLNKAVSIMDKDSKLSEEDYRTLGTFSGLSRVDKEKIGTSLVKENDVEKIIEMMEKTIAKNKINNRS